MTMPRYFFDSSSIVKRYYREPGTNWVLAVCDRRIQPFLYLSDIARVEVVSALRRAGRLRNAHHSAVDAVANIFERHVRLSDSNPNDPVYHFVTVGPAILGLAARLCNRFWMAAPYALRSLDAIQLASAMAARVDSSEAVQFITADARLEAIAQQLGFDTDNPLRHP